MTGRVLIVDDSLTVRMDLAEAFESGGLEPVPCGTVGDALRTLDAGTVDAIILDVHLPDGDGVDLLRDLRADPRHAATPVLMLSTEAEVKDRVLALRTGADEYVGKPYDAGHVVARARQLIGAATRAASAQPAVTETSVLLIDDSRTLREELRQALEGAGYTVVTAATGEDGLRMAGGRRPDLMIVDGMLPGIDGATVIRRVRLDAALRDVPCLLLTASTDRYLELDVLDAGADAFVRKDEDTSVLLAKVAAMVRQSGRAVSTASSTSLYGPKKILAVDADAAYLDTLTDHLRTDGYDVVQARTGEAAIELLATQPVDCILLAPRLPGLSGADTCQLIKGAPAVRDTPLILLGTGTGVGDVLTGLGDGADDYVAKTDLDVLRGRVRAQLRRKHFQDEHRRAHEDRLRQELESAQARAAHELASARAELIRELEWKNSELEAFSYSVSHDLRNPLNIVDGFSELLLDEYADVLDKAAVRYLTSIRGAAGRMTEMVGSLLRLSHAGRADITRTAVDVSAVACGTVEALRLREPDRDVHVEVAGGLVATADAALLAVVLENLIGNAWKYTRRTDRPRIEVFGSRVDGRPVFHVRDNGAGFPMEHAENLFRAYGRLHTDLEFPGTGIGLATVFRVIDRHGGQIWAEGEPGVGATFSFTTGEPSAGPR